MIRPIENFKVSPFKTFFLRLIGNACWRCHGTGEAIWFGWAIGPGGKEINRPLPCPACHGTGVRQA